MRVSSIRSIYGNDANFFQAFSVQSLNYLLEEGRETMVLCDSYPSLSISRYAFGNTIVRALIAQHLVELVKAYGIKADVQGVDAIADDIISGYPYLKITEVILALKMMREGKFRTGQGGADNRGKMYGYISTSVVCDCINRFCSEYRDQVIEKDISERKKVEISKSMANAATRKEKFDIFLAASLDDPTCISSYKIFLNEEEMATLEYYAKEREALRLLFHRVEQYVATPPDDRDISQIKKGVEYINKNFPFDPQSIQILDKLKDDK